MSFMRQHFGQLIANRGLAIALTSSVLITNCAQENGLDSINSKKSGSESFNAGKKTSLFDFEKECGLSKEKMDDKNAVLVDGNYTSYPIIVQGTDSLSGTDFLVITEAKLKINATAEASTTTVNVSLKDSASGASGFIGMFAPMIVKGKAESAAKAASGTTTSTGLPKAEWLKLTGGSNAEYKDLLCVSSGTKSVNIRKGGTNATITYTPALISAINPLAPIARMRKEIGSGKSFAVTATVQGSGDDLAKGSVQGRISVREISPVFSYNGTTINTDIAYEFINEFPGGAYKVGLPKRQIFYIDTTKKQIRVIVNEDDKIDDNTKKPLPPVYLVRDP